MSKKTNKTKNVSHTTKAAQLSDRSTEEKILDELLECSGCADFGSFKYDQLKKKYDCEHDYFIDNLPAVNYVIGEIINYMFSNGLTTGETEKDIELKKFLYRKNGEQITNYDVLKTAISNSIKMGECGIRLYEENLYLVRKGRYAPIIKKENGIKKIVAWIMSKNDGAVNEIKFDENVRTMAEVVSSLENNGYILLDNTEFSNIKNSNEELHGKSSFDNDKLRLNLLSKAYERLSYDVEYDGPGRIIIRPKSGYISSDDNELSTSVIVNESTNRQKNAVDKAKKEAERVARDIKNSTSETVIVLSDSFDKDITHLPKTTKATEFFDWIGNDVEIVCQVLGIDPALVGAGKISGNISMEKIIDNGMLNTIIPLREKYSVQFSDLISRFLDCEKVFFNKYEMRQQETTLDKLERLMNMSYKMLVGTKDTNGGELKDDILTTVKSINQVAQRTLVKDNGDLKTIEEL